MHRKITLKIGVYLCKDSKMIHLTKGCSQRLSLLADHMRLLYLCGRVQFHKATQPYGCFIIIVSHIFEQDKGAIHPMGS